MRKMRAIECNYTRTKKIGRNKLIRIAVSAYARHASPRTRSPRCRGGMGQYHVPKNAPPSLRSSHPQLRRNPSHGFDYERHMFRKFKAQLFGGV